MTTTSLTTQRRISLQQALKHSNCKLKTLDLSNNNFTDNAAKDFAAALEHSNCKLETLDLSFNNFTDNAAKDFAAALKHSNCKLKMLYCSEENFTKEGRRYFTDAEKQSNCQVVYILKDKNPHMLNPVIESSYNLKSYANKIKGEIKEGPSIYTSKETQT